MDPNDVVITGLPRSGTTLTCELLNAVPNTVALDEPMDRAAWSGRPRGAVSKMLRRKSSRALDPKHFMGEVDRFFDQTRRSLIEGKGATSLNVGGEVFGGKFKDERSDTGLRQHRRSSARSKPTRSFLPTSRWR